MARRSDEREAARAEYMARKEKGGEVNLRQLADDLHLKYDTVRRWKSKDNLDTLRKRSRDAYMGIPLAAGAIKTLRTNVIGSGLVPTPQVDADYLHLTEEQADQLQAQITREFSLWADCTACDASGMDNFWRMQTLAFTSFLMNGDLEWPSPHEP